MSHQIARKLKSENGVIIIESCSNNVRPRYYYTSRMEDNENNRAKVRQWIIDRVLQPVNKRTNFIKSLKIENYFDGTPFDS